MIFPTKMLTKLFLVFVLSFIFAFQSSSQVQLQNTDPCFFDTYLKQHQNHANKFEKTIQSYLNIQKFTGNKLQSGSTKIIPVVVHIIHNGSTENISDAQIQSQIDVLNEDFRKIIGSNGFGNGVDTEVEFCLAKITPDGKCTNGIVRIQSQLANHQTYQRSMLKNLSYWDNTRYLNMYVVKSINGTSGTLGYSSFPGGPPDEDGIVVRHNYFGKIGTAAGTLGRTTTHEISHWFGLYHTFNNGCGVDTCTDGDYVCDTPPVALPNFGCPNVNSCSNDFPNVNDQVQNYLDYTNDACKNMFTAGQKQRMDATLNTFRWNIWQYTNIVSTGCDSGYISPTCNAVADFTANAQRICIGNPVLFTNKSLNNCTTFFWSFQGGNPVTSILPNPLVTYSTLGNYSVSLIATNAIGTDSVLFTNYITVTTPTVGQNLPFAEDFETSTFPPNGITVDNPDGGVTWELDTTAIKFSGMGSAKINNLINTNYGQSDALIFPNFDLSSFVGAPRLTFRWAYAKSDPSYSDELLVLISTDCGVNFSQLFYRTGTSMTTGTTQTTPYIPNSATVWKMANINLSAYANSNSAILKIVNVTDGGNNLYIDSINIGGFSTGTMEFNETQYNVNVFPNPTTDIVTLNFTLNQPEPVKISIFNTLGQQVFTEEGDLGSGLHNKKFPIEKWGSSTFYLMHLTIGNKAITKKVLIQR